MNADAGLKRRCVGPSYSPFSEGRGYSTQVYQFSRVPYFGVVGNGARYVSDWQPEFQAAKTIYHRIEAEEVGPQEVMEYAHSSEKRSTSLSERRGPE